MEQFNKNKMLKSYILGDKDRFALAVDVYENFEAISDDILRFVTESPIKIMNDNNGWNLELTELGRMAGYYYFKVMVNQTYYLLFQCQYYFKTYAIFLRDKACGFDPQSDEQLVIRELMQKEFSEVVEESYFISSVKNSIYELNVGNSFIDLFEVYNSPDVLKKFSDNFIERFEGVIARILNILKSIQEEPKANTSCEN